MGEKHGRWKKFQVVFRSLAPVSSKQGPADVAVPGEDSHTKQSPAADGTTHIPNGHLQLPDHQEVKTTTGAESSVGVHEAQTFSLADDP